ncbi:MAG TPA: efflux RND transporter permease subunit [Bryobacteraceae bacterium]|nr:efflux RND transporter permease subunit [Bryobacteraceae bacterium]
MNQRVAGRAGLADRHLRGRDLPRFSIDNLSLMALTIATGIVVDDATVMNERAAAPGG